jgi:A/G-specific adenine glycosylase
MGILTPEISPQEIRRFQSHLLNWFAEKQRPLPWRETRDPYRIWVSEVMLQQTQVKTILEYYPKFIDRFPTLEDLSRTDLADVLKYWEKMGYYARARNLHQAAQKVVQDFAGKIPENYPEFRGLPGVGEYIAAAVLSLAFGQPFAVVDGNVKRVLARRFLLETPVNQSSAKRAFQNLADLLLAREQPANFNQAIMELGALICRPQNPLCAECPVQTGCRAFETGRQTEFPVSVKPKPVPHYHLAAGIIFLGEKMLIVKRPAAGLLGGLWEFPNERLQPNEQPEPACRRILQELTGLEVELKTFVTQIKHAYTHFKITMEIFRGDWIRGEVNLNGPADFRWIKPSEMTDFAFTGATHKFMRLVK